MQILTKDDANRAVLEFTLCVIHETGRFDLDLFRLQLHAKESQSIPLTSKLLVAKVYLGLGCIFLCIRHGVVIAFAPHGIAQVVFLFMFVYTKQTFGLQPGCFLIFR